MANTHPFSLSAAGPSNSPTVGRRAVLGTLLLAAASGCAGSETSPTTASASGNQSATKITLWGDSMTAYGSGYGEFLQATLPHTSVFVAGVGGETSSAIAARQGALPYLVKPVTGTIPASGGVQVSFAPNRDAWPLLQGNGIPNASDRSLPAVLQGVAGRLTLSHKVGDQVRHDPNDQYTFTRLSAGKAVAVKSPTALRPTFGEQHRGDTVVIWAGRNNFLAAAQIRSDIEAMVSFLNSSSRRALILGITTSSNDTPAQVSAIKALNATLSKRWGGQFLDVLNYLLKDGLAAAKISPTSADTQYIKAGVVPTSLRRDATHLTQVGRELVANLVGQKLHELGWVSTFQPQALS